MVYVPTLFPVHRRRPPALKAAAPGSSEAQRRLCFSDTASRRPETTVTGDNRLFCTPVLISLSYCPGAMNLTIAMMIKKYPIEACTMVAPILTGALKEFLVSKGIRKGSKLT